MKVLETIEQFVWKIIKKFLSINFCHTDAKIYPVMIKTRPIMKEDRKRAGNSTTYKLKQEETVQKTNL